MRGGKILGGRAAGTDGDYARSGQFNARDVFDVDGASYEIDVLLVGPGGGGGGHTGGAGAGGGGGEVVAVLGFRVQRGKAFTVTLPAGGAGGTVAAGSNGAGNTVFGPYVARPGFGGSALNAAGGASGGSLTSGGAGATNVGGGGGGAAGNGAAGVDPYGGTGGVGYIFSWWDGLQRVLGAGGGGGSYNYTVVAPPGSATYPGTAGYGGDYDTSPSAPTANYGGGGGGASFGGGGVGSAGAMGSVWIRHRGTTLRASGYTGTATHDGWRYYQFTSSGTFTA